jgi:hypothetical protein
MTNRTNGREQSLPFFCRFAMIMYSRTSKPTCSDTGGQPTQNSAALLAVRAGLSDRIFLTEYEQPRPA